MCQDFFGAVADTVHTCFNLGWICKHGFVVGRRGYCCSKLGLRFGQELGAFGWACCLRCNIGSKWGCDWGLELEVVERGKWEGMELEWLPVVGTETVGGGGGGTGWVAWVAWVGGSRTDVVVVDFPMSPGQ